MNPAATFAVILFLALFIFVAYFVFKLSLSIGMRKRLEKEKASADLSFMIGSFHEVVAKLKEKEKELETLKKQAEDRASSFEIYNENILQSVPSGVVSFDQELSVTRMNMAAQKILGVDEIETMGKKFSEVFEPPISGLLEARNAVERMECAYTTRAGKRIWLGLNISPLRDGLDNEIGRLLIFTDLTELKAFQSQMELRERLSSLGEMSAGIAHELRNPMAVISGYTKILSKKADEALLPAVDSISKEISVMDRIIADFLSFAKPVEPVVAYIKTEELIEGCLASIPRIGDGIKVSIDTAGLPGFYADEVMMRQAVVNLLLNAVDAMPEGGELSIMGRSNDFIEIAVSDTGHGIPSGIRDKIFQPFFSTKERGTGLGLSIVHKIAVSHGGMLLCESSSGGTTFTMRLPKGR